MGRYLEDSQQLLAANVSGGDYLIIWDTDDLYEDPQGDFHPTAKYVLIGTLEDILKLTPSDGSIIVGDGSNFVTESGVTARTSLGLGSISTEDSSSYLAVTNNLSDLGNPGTARTNLGLGTISTFNSGDYLATANNLSDLNDVPTARSNLGLGSIATEDTTSYLSVSNNLSDLGSASTARTNLGLGTLALINDAPSDGNRYARKNGAWDIAIGGATLNSRVNILSLTPNTGELFYATDTNEFILYDGSNFFIQPLEFSQKSINPNIGLQLPMVSNDLLGYGRRYITDKLLANSKIGGNTNTDEGSIGISNGVFQIVLGGSAKTITTGINFREDNKQLEHKPENYWFEAATGNTNQLSLSGIPVFQEYKTDIGAFQTPIIFRGRAL